MKKIMFLAASSLAILATPTMAHADDDSGWYLRANAGYGTHHDAEFDQSMFIGDIESEGNVAGSLGVGYDFGNNWRLELDGDTLWTDMGAVGNEFNSSAKLRTNTLMLNAIYDFDDFGRLSPYVGLGAGLVQGKLNAQAHDGLASSTGPVIFNRACYGGTIPGACSINDKDTTWGWQALAGVGYEISDNLFWDTHYTYMDTAPGGLDFDSTYTPLAGIPGYSVINHIAELDDVGAHTLMTGLRYKFGGSTPPPPPPPPPAPKYKTCSDTGARVLVGESCPTPPPPPPPPPPVVEYTTCPDGTRIVAGNACPAPVSYVTCPDGSQTTDLAFCQPVVTAPVLAYNDCGASNVAIFNVPVNKTPKQMPRLGTMPEFGDSHGLTPDQFFQKLQARYNSSATDKAYLNYLFKSMGYSNGFADAQSYMFSEDVLPVGTRGMLGLGKQHHYEYSVLPSSDRDRQAFRIQSANGAVVHFMKTCGNYMYACN